MESSSGWLKQIIIFIMCVCIKIALFSKSGELDTKTWKFIYKEQAARRCSWGGEGRIICL